MRPTIILEHLRMAFIKLAKPEKTFLLLIDTAKVRQKKPQHKSTCAFASQNNYRNTELVLSWFNSAVNCLTISLKRITCRMTKLHRCNIIFNYRSE
jgi:hypothetical protein